MRKAILCALFTSVCCEYSAAQRATNSLVVFFPDASWAVQIDAEGFVVKVDETKPDGRRYVLAENDRTKLTISVTLERTPGAATFADCESTLRQRLDKPGPVKPANAKTSSSKDFAVLEYIVHEFEGMPIEQKNVFACAAKGDSYVDIHVSKVQYSKRDDEIFAAILKATYLTDRVTPASASSSHDYWLKGGALFDKGDFAGAIEPYQKALDLEKKIRQLSPDYWRVLIDNLGMAYGITGKLDSAEATLRYGIENDPTYPMFYYVLACNYAERGDIDRAAEHLSTAFKFRDNLIKGEKMPDPKTDDSFQRFMKVEKFRKLVESLQ